MKKFTAALLVAGAINSSLLGLDFDISLSGSKNGLDAFSFSIGEYYKAPQREILVVQERLSKNDMSVAYFLARKASRNIDYITKLRVRGDSWWDISISLGLNPRDVYVVKTQKRQGPPYGKAYGYDKNKKKSRLSDGEIAELVNVKFLSAYHGVSADEIIEQRRKGDDFVNIDKNYHEKKAQRSDKKSKREWRGNSKKEKDDKRGNSKGRYRE